MDSNTLQILLMINVFLVGIFTTIAIRHAYRHFRPEQNNETPKPTHPKPKQIGLPPEVKEQLLLSSQEHFKDVLNHSAKRLEKDLRNTAAKLNKQLDKVGTNILLNEMKRYRMDLEMLRKQAETVINNAQADVVKHQAELKDSLAKQQTELETKMKSEIEDEKKYIIKQIDTKISDSIASFLTETMQHNVDLGAQIPYITSILESHKAEIIKEIDNEV